MSEFQIGIICLIGGWMLGFLSALGLIYALTKEKKEK